MSEQEDRYDEYSKRFEELVKASVERECPMTPRQQVDVLKNLLKDAEEEIEAVVDDYQDISRVLMEQCAENNTLTAATITLREIILGLCGKRLSPEEAVEKLTECSVVQRQVEDIDKMHRITNEVSWLQGCVEVMAKLRDDKSTDACEAFINEQKDFDLSLKKLFELVAELNASRNSKD